ncbi:MAG: VWA domain-containing protein [Pseudomonadota bacterium]
MSVSRALEPFLALPAALRQHGFAVSPDQTVGFLAAVNLLGPRSLDDIYRAARAVLAIPPEREAEFMALFRAIFLGETVPGQAPLDAEEDAAQAHEPAGADTEAEAGPEEEPGDLATRAERLGQRQFPPADDATALRQFAARAASALPRRIARRRAAARRGDRPDLARAMAHARRTEGEVVTLPWRRRVTRQRRIVLLIDVSGSMAARTEPALRVGHALVAAGERVEVFTLGTRLTRITRPLRQSNADRALAEVAGLVADIDGGTRIGAALSAFLDVPRYGAFASGAAVVVISDGLERAGPEALAHAVRRMSRRAWRLDWLTPLAADPGFRPETAALKAILPMLDTLGDGSSVPAITEHLLTMGRV